MRARGKVLTRFQMSKEDPCCFQWKIKNSNNDNNNKIGFIELKRMCKT